MKNLLFYIIIGVFIFCLCVYQRDVAIHRTKVNIGKHCLTYGEYHEYDTPTHKFVCGWKKREELKEHMEN